LTICRRFYVKRVQSELPLRSFSGPSRASRRDNSEFPRFKAVCVSSALKSRPWTAEFRTADTVRKSATTSADGTFAFVRAPLRAPIPSNFSDRPRRAAIACKARSSRTLIIIRLKRGNRARDRRSWATRVACVPEAIRSTGTSPLPSVCPCPGVRTRPQFCSFPYRE